MTSNPILDELHAARRQLLAEAGGDLHRYVQQSRERLLASGRTVIEPPVRIKEPVETTGNSVSGGEAE